MRSTARSRGFAARLAEARALVRSFEERLRADPISRRRAGRYYTPDLLVRFLSTRVLEPLAARDGLRVVDPAAGAGAFLLGALEVLVHARVARGVDEPTACRGAASELHGLDTDEEAIAVARRAIELAAGHPAPHVRTGDALDDARGLVAQGPFDAVLGNPPWLREKDARDVLLRARATSLGKKYSTARMDLWYLFAHAALEALAPGGRHGFVVPAYWLEAASARKLREHLRSVARLDLLAELGQRPFFQGVSARAVVYACERPLPGPPSPAKRGRAGEGAATIERIVLAPPTPDEPPLEPALLDGASHPAISRVHVPARELFLEDGSVARVTSTRDALALALVEENGVRGPFLVGEGITPGPERVFVVEDDFARRADLSADERALLLPWVTPQEVPSFPERPRPTKVLLALRTDGDGKLAPRLLRHLEPHRATLERRRETRKGVRPWFALHWPRDPELVKGPRALLVRMAKVPRATFVDEPLGVGESVLVFRGAPAQTLRLVAALLETAPLATWLLARAKRRGVGIDVSVARAREIPWPRALLEDPDAVEPVARALEQGDRARADELAWALYGARGATGRPPTSLT